MPSKRAIVAGAGIGILPWAVSVKPEPTGIGEAYNVADDTTYRKYALLSYAAPLLDAKLYYTRIPLPRFLLNTLAAWSEWKAKHITHGPPKVEKATIDLMYNNY